MKSSLTLLVKAPYVIEVASLPIPPLRKKEILVKTILSGISHGTELAVLRGTTPSFLKKWSPDYRIYVKGKPSKNYPATLGYETVGQIVRIGKQVDGVKIGDTIWVDAPHQEYSVINVEQHQFYKIPNERLARRAVFLALTRVALAGIHDARIKLGERIAVFGLGTVGLITIQLANLASQTPCFGVDPFELRRKMAKNFSNYTLDPNREDPGLKIHKYTNREGVDVAIETSGSFSALHQAIRSCKMGGRVVTVGTYREGAPDLFLSEEWHRNRIELISSMSVNGCFPRDYPLWTLERLNQVALQLLLENKVKVEEFVTQIYPFRQATEAYRYLMKYPEKTIKIALEYT